MKTIPLSLKNKKGETLGARLELPIDSHPHNFALFAHCFTCNKNLTAIRNISRALSQKGIALLRFDFTGLGESEGEFENTNFSSNVEDLLAAADFLKNNYAAPTILIGHSLGGAAVLVAKQYLSSVKAIATIGAPYEPIHVKHLIKNGVAKIEKEGKAEVNIGGRNFSIQKQFLEDIQSISTKALIQKLNAALLVLHSPKDEIVNIENATQIYKAARHPRSYISLDEADHLLSDKKDSVYAGEVIANWASRYIEIPQSEEINSPNQVLVRNEKGAYTSEIKSGIHHLLADEPEEVGGNNFGPTPYDFLLVALGACTAMTLRMYAQRKNWDLEEVKVYLNHEKIYAADCEDCETKEGKIDRIERFVELEGNLDESQIQKLLEIADKCPVHRTLHSEILVRTQLQPKIPKSIELNKK